MHTLRNIIRYSIFGVSLLAFSLTGAGNSLAGYEENASNSQIASSGMGGGKSRSSGGGKSRGSGGGGKSRSMGGGKTRSMGGGKSRSRGTPSRPPVHYTPKRDPGHVHYPPPIRHVNKYYPPTYVTPPVTYPPTYSPPTPAYTPPVYTPPPVYIPPPEEIPPITILPPVIEQPQEPPPEEPPPEEPVVDTITIIIIIDGVEIPVDIPIEIIDEGIVIEVESGDGTIIYVIPCNEDVPPVENPTGGNGYWKWVPPGEGLICGYWIWVSTDITIIDVFPPVEEPGTTIIDVFPPVDTGIVTGLNDVIVVVVLGDGTIIDLLVPIDIVNAGTIIEIPIGGEIIYIIIGNEDVPPIFGPIDGLGYWQWIEGFDGISGYWLWVPLDAEGNPLTTFVNIFNPSTEVIVVAGVAGNTVTLPFGITIVVIPGEGISDVVIITDPMGNTQSIAVAAENLTSVITIPLSNGVNVYVVLEPQGTVPTAVPAGSPSGHWEWIAATATSKGYWIWVPTPGTTAAQPKAVQYKPDPKNKPKGSFQKVPAGKPGPQDDHLRWVPQGKGAKQVAPKAMQQPSKGVVQPVKKQAMQPVKASVDQKQKSQVDKPQKGKGHLKWVPADKTDQSKKSKLEQLKAKAAQQKAKIDQKQKSKGELKWVPADQTKK